MSLNKIKCHEGSDFLRAAIAKLPRGQPDQPCQCGLCLIYDLPADLPSSATSFADICGVIIAEWMRSEKHVYLLTFNLFHNIVD